MSKQTPEEKAEAEDQDEVNIVLSHYKVVKNAKLRNRYNQVTHLTRDTVWESDKYTR